MDEEEVVTRDKLKKVIGLTKNFLEKEHFHPDQLEYMESNESILAFPLDSDYSCFLEILPKRLEEGKMYTAIRCVPETALHERKTGDPYEELRNAWLYAIFDDTKLGSLLVLRCEDRLRGYNPIFMDKDENIVQSKPLGTERIPSLGTRLVRNFRTERLAMNMHACYR